MTNEIMENHESKGFFDQVKDAESGFLRTVQKTEGLDGVDDVREISRSLADIVENTELPPKFEVRDITSSTNKVVQSKMELIAKAPGLNIEKVIPEFMTSEYPVEFDDEIIKKAPWVNIIHGWMKVLNCLNSVSAIQKKEDRDNDDLNTLFSISSDLYKLTLKGSEEFKRRSLDFSAGKKYSETFRRENSELGVNAERKINFLELRYILGVVKESYLKDSRK